LTCSIAAWKVLNRRRPGIPAALFGGLSLGEYSAQVAAGALDFETALKVVDRRATLMQKACEETEGGMVSVIGLDEAAVQSILAGQPGTVTIANLNCPGQIVVSGEKALLPGIAEQAKAAGARMSVVLKVAGAFHSPLMENAARDFHAFLSDIPVHKSALTRVLSNVSGSPYPENADWATAMSRQITRPVYWEKNLRFALDAGIRDFIELGPGKTLCGMLRRIDRSAACRNLETRESLDAIAANEPGPLRESP
jgi:[acyl-carrier-protein] S-malonyltransferase